jgi:hypothetical protein
MIPESLIEYVGKFIGKNDDSGMTAGLYIVFDDLHFGATPNTLVDIAALSLVFASLNGADIETLLRKRIEHLTGCATHSLPISGVTNIGKILAIPEKTLVMTIKHSSANANNDDVIEIKDQEKEQPEEKEQPDIVELATT